MIARGLFALLLLFPVLLQAQSLPWYQVEQGTPLRLSTPPIVFKSFSSSEILKVRVMIKKLFVTKTPEGARVRFEPVCEENASIEVEDLTGGRGIVQEKLIVACQAEIQGNTVAVAVSGMVYDNSNSHFSDEGRRLARNFMTHLSLHTQDQPILYGLGDFNLGYTRDFPFRHWVSELSTDAAGGKLASISESTTREGFVAAVRYTQND